MGYYRWRYLHTDAGIFETPPEYLVTGTAIPPIPEPTVTINDLPPGMWRELQEVKALLRDVLAELRRVRDALEAREGA